MTHYKYDLEKEDIAGKEIVLLPQTTLFEIAKSKVTVVKLAKVCSVFVIYINF
jgi:hypothetical protein